MRWKSEDILAILDQCAANFTFPMLDNGYVYLAATRLSLHRTEVDWGMVLEVFGYSPRAGLPDTHTYTFASSLQNRDSEQKYKSRQGYESYLANNPHNKSRFVFPLTSGDWQDPDSCDYVAEDATALVLRGRTVKLPSLVEYGQHAIELEDPPRVRVFELCRFLADIDRESVLSNPAERRVSLSPEMKHILQLEEWNHPNIAEGEVPSESRTFQQLAQVLITGDCYRYRPSQLPNTIGRTGPTAVPCEATSQ